MSFKKYFSVSFSVLGLLLATSLSHAGAPVDPDADYDRLDGTGSSGKKVNVIEWEGNLEVHVYPGGSLKGLSLKLDKKNKDKPVMVIGYRFNDNPGVQLIRRAILGVPFTEGFKAYSDPKSGSEYDKIIISNNGLSGGVVAYRLEPEAAQLYPDGHPALMAKEDPKKAEKRAPAAADDSGSQEPGESSGVDEDSGAIKPFFMKAERSMNRR